MTAANYLVDGGLFAFTAEFLPESECSGEETEGGDPPCEGWRLQPSGRFAHTPTYLKSLGEMNGFELTVYQRIVPRMEGGKPVQGQLLVFQRTPRDVHDEL